MFLCGGTKSPAGGHIYENYCLESCFNCKNRFRPSLSRIDFFWKAPRPAPFVFFFVCCCFFLLVKIFRKVGTPPPPPWRKFLDPRLEPLDGFSWILEEMKYSWSLKSLLFSGHIRPGVNPGVSKNRSQRGNFFDFEITQLHTLCISYVEECGKK